MSLNSPRFASSARLKAAAKNKPAMNWGEVGEPVRIVQQALIDLGAAMEVTLKKHGTPDGIFGDETKERVRAFQSKHGLVADGIVGKGTLTKLDELLPKPGKPLPSIAADSWITHRFRIVMRSITIPTIPEFQALEDTRLIFGMYGFRVEEGAGMSLLLNPAEQVQLNVIDGACLWDEENPEQTQLFALGGGRAGVSNSEIMVYYVNRIKVKDGEPLNGCAGHKPGRPACVVSANANKYDMGHEIGHVLLGSDFVPVHHPSTNNLMFEDLLTADPPGLDEAQVRKMRRSPFCFKR